RLECRGAQRLEKRGVVRGARRVVAAHRRRDIPHDRFRGHAAGFLAARRTADAVGDEEQCGETLAEQRQALDVRQARGMDDGVRMHGAEEKVVLILLPYFARMREPEHIELAVARLWAELLRRGRSEQLSETHMQPDRE